MILMLILILVLVVVELVEIFIAQEINIIITNKMTALLGL